MVNLAIIGCGAITIHRHAPECAASSKINLAGVFDVNLERTKEIAEQFQCKAYATFAAEIFKDNTSWGLVNQHKGVVSLPNGGYGALAFAKKYKDIDLTVTARDYADTSNTVARTDIYFKFTNGAYISFATEIVNDANSIHNGELKIFTLNQGQNTADDNKAIYTKWNAWGFLSDEMKTQYTTSGLDIHVVRYGTNIYLSVGEGEDEEVIAVADLTKNASYSVTEGMEATVEIRHWNDSGVNVEIPFEVSETVREVGGKITYSHASNKTVSFVVANDVTDIELTVQQKLQNYDTFY